MAECQSLTHTLMPELGNVSLLHTLPCDQCTHYFLTAGALPRIRAAFGQGRGPIFLDNLFCNGTESQLVDCPNPGVGVHNCGHFEDAGVVCAGMITPSVC